MGSRHPEISAPVSRVCSVLTYVKSRYTFAREIPENRLGGFPVPSQILAVHDDQAGAAPLGLEGRQVVDRRNGTKSTLRRGPISAGHCVYDVQHVRRTRLKIFVRRKTHDIRSRLCANPRHCTVAHRSLFRCFILSPALRPACRLNRRSNPVLASSLHLGAIKPIQRCCLHEHAVTSCGSPRHLDS